MISTILKPFIILWRVFWAIILFPFRAVYWVISKILGFILRLLIGIVFWLMTGLSLTRLRFAYRWLIWALRKL